ncbi:MAG: helix-turn-helix domain-containing protein [Gammaproteobacteria bacterium]
MTDSWMERAKMLMQTRGISQESLASSLSCTRGAVGHYLSGRRTPSLEQLQRLAEALETDPAWLVFGTGNTGVGDTGAVYTNAGNTLPLAAEIHPRGTRNRRASLSPPATTTDCYAVLININDYEPRIHAGEALLIQPVNEPAAGDEVIIYYRDKSIKLHTFLKADEDHIIIDSIVGEKQVRSLAKSDCKLIHKVAAIFRPTDPLKV